MNDWLNSLKVGDEVAVLSGDHFHNFDIVERVTETRIILSFYGR